MGCPLFMPYQNVFDVVLMKNGIIDVQYRTTWIAKNKFDTFVFKTLDNDVSAAEFQFYALMLLIEAEKNVLQKRVSKLLSLTHFVKENPLFYLDFQGF
jgi:hypothetical protein